MAKDFTNIDQLITDYVKGNLSGDALELFEMKLAQNTELQEKVALEKATLDLFLDADALELKAMMRSDLSSQPKSKTINKKWWLGGLGLAIVVTSGLLFIEVPEDLASENEENKAVEQVATFPVEKSNGTSLEPEVEVHEETQREIHTVQPHHFEEVKEEMHEEEKVVDVIASTTISQNSANSELTIEDKSEPKATVEEKNQETTSSDPCEGVTFKGDVKIQKEEKGLENGVISVDEAFIQGGTKPYLFSLTRDEFSNQTSFEGLSSQQKYAVFIKDDKGCVGMLNNGAIAMPSTLCKSDYQSTFSITYEQEWQVPINDYSAAEVQLINKTGQVLVKKQVDENEPFYWDGQFDNDNRAVPGRYNWYITYPSGERCLVKMTVVD